MLKMFTYWLGKLGSKEAMNEALDFALLLALVYSMAYITSE